MDLAGTYSFPAAPPDVWKLLMDADAIASCLPGCRGLRLIDENRYQAELTIGVAAITGTFTVVIALLEQMPPHSYRLDVDATGKPGFARGSAAVALDPQDGGTRVSVTAHADAGGLIARVGQRLLEGVARVTMDRFFACLSKRLTGAGEATG